MSQDQWKGLPWIWKARYDFESTGLWAFNLKCLLAPSTALHLPPPGLSSAGPRQVAGQTFTTAGRAGPEEGSRGGGPGGCGRTGVVWGRGLCPFRARPAYPCTYEASLPAPQPVPAPPLERTPRLGV